MKNLNVLLPIIIIIAASFFNPLVGLLVFIIFIVYKLITRRDLIFAIRGSRAYKNNNLQEALKLYKKAATCKNSSIKGIKTYIILMLKNGDYTECGKFYDNLMESKKIKNEELYLLKPVQALIKWKLGDIETATSILYEILELEESSSTYEYLGYLLILKGDLNEALELNLKAYEYNSTEVIKANLGEIYYKLNDFTKASFYFNELIVSGVNFAEPYYFNALIKEKEGDIKSAISSLTKAKTFDESFLSNLTKSKIDDKIQSLKSI